MHCDSLKTNSHTLCNFSFLDHSLVPYPYENVQSSFNHGKQLAKNVLFTNWIHLPLKSADDPPNLSTLRNFTVKEGAIDIAEKIGTNYEHFGTLLLNDNDGTKVKNIEMSKRGDPVHVTVEILKQWRQGKGRRPVTWQTLIDCLRGTGLNVLADKIEHSLSSHNGSEGSERSHSEL